MKTSTENNNSITNKQTASIKCIDCSRVPKIQINYDNPEYLNIKCNCSINKQIKIKHSENKISLVITEHRLLRGILKDKNKDKIKCYLQ